MHPLELCFRNLRVQNVKIAFVFHRVGSVKIFNELFNNSCQFFLKARPLMPLRQVDQLVTSLMKEPTAATHSLPPAPRLRD